MQKAWEATGTVTGKAIDATAEVASNAATVISNTLSKDQQIPISGHSISAENADGS